MQGRQVFMDNLVAHGADAIFGNPGTTENPLLESLHDYPSVHYYTALHEGVAVCAAGYYAQASGKTGVANVHVAPGLGNAIGMMYGALKATVPVIVTAGQQDTRMRLRDPILRHDLVAMAAPVSKWAAEVQTADEMAPIMRRAFQIANATPRGPVFVALPIDVMAQDTTIKAHASGTLYRQPVPSAAAIAATADILLASKNPVIFAGDEIAIQDASAELTRLVERLGATVYIEFLHARQPIAVEHPAYAGKIPYYAQGVHDLVADHDVVLMIGGPFVEEVWFDAVAPFGAQKKVLQIESADTRLARNYALDLGVVGYLPDTLAALNDALKQGPNTFNKAAQQRLQALENAKNDKLTRTRALLDKRANEQPMSAAVALDALARALPGDVIVIDEAVTAAFDLEDAFRPRAPDGFYAGRGGGIGQGIAGAIGTAIAHPTRLIVAASGDGSAMYSIQALWTAAHHALNILFVIISNREYRVLKHNMDVYRDRFRQTPEQAYPHMDLNQPLLGFTDMAKGMGVPACEARTRDEVTNAAQNALAIRGPYLMDLVVAGKE